ncbi:hypothetical protein B0H13DRAFT_1600338, partial [Mycena leptocephala]
PPTKSTALDDSTQAQARKRCSSLDAPLAIQLRPGLSIGADGAWLVCFFDELLGWFAMLVPGGREFN